MISFVYHVTEVTHLLRSMRRINARHAIKRQRNIKRILMTTMQLINNFNNKVKLDFNNLILLTLLTLI